MELDDFKAAWATLDTRTSSIESVLRRQQTANRARAMRAPLRWLGLGQAVQLVIWILVVAVAAPFWIEHRAVPHLLAAGLVLHTYGVLVIVSSVLHLLLVGRTYHTAPVLLFQRRVAELRRFRIINSLALGLPWWILWVPATMIGARRWFGLDLYAASPEWIWSSMAVGAAGLVACLLAARWISRRPVQSPFVRRLLDDVAGISLKRVSRELKEIQGFASVR